MRRPPGYPPAGRLTRSERSHTRSQPRWNDRTSPMAGVSTVPPGRPRGRTTGSGRPRPDWHRPRRSTTVSDRRHQQHHTSDVDLQVSESRSSTSVRATGADLITSANLGCSMQITRALGDQGNALHVAQYRQGHRRAGPLPAQPSALPHGNGANAPARGKDLLFAGDQSALRNLGVAWRPRRRTRRLGRSPADTAAEPRSGARSRRVPGGTAGACGRASTRKACWAAASFSRQRRLVPRRDSYPIDRH
jgi:hypothetical protein